MGSDIRELLAKARALLSEGGTTESTGGSGPIDDCVLSSAIEKKLREITAPTACADTSSEPDTAQKIVASKIVARARAALNRSQGIAEVPSVSNDELSALELIVRTIGRPALRFRNGRVDTPENRLGDNSRWYVLVTLEREAINSIASSVGRIACENGLHQAVLGTGWRSGRDLLVTNRHVAELLVHDRSASPATWKIDPEKKPFVDFSYDDGGGRSANFGITELVYCSDKRDIDVAILRMESKKGPLPAAIPIDWDESALGRLLPASNTAPAVFQGGEIYAVGHPYRRQSSEQTRPVFGDADGRKRCSPGMITALSSDQPILLHDCSTLGGNSGSCVVSTESVGHAIVGLHFGGNEANTPLGSGLGSTNYAIAFARLGNHCAANRLRKGE